MRVLLHDYAGHAFQADLSRQLAARGHQVLHVSCGNWPAPKGLLERREGDSGGLSFRTLELPGDFAKYSFVNRVRQEWVYGRRSARLLAEWRSDVMIACNIPLDPLAQTVRAARRLGIPVLFWHQDVYSIAIRRYFRARLGAIGELVGRRYERIEADAARGAAAVVAITEGFVPVLRDWGVPRDNITVIPNWAPLSSLPRHPRANDWSREHGLHDKRVLLYAGSLGLKHDPEQLLSLARAFRDDGDVVVLVVSSDSPTIELRQRADAEGLDNLRILPFQPVERVAEMQATASVLLSMLEAGAGVFSVPSKVLAQFCIGRPMLASMPAENDAARAIRDSGAGIVVEPDDRDGWVDAARKLLSDPERARHHGDAARAYAEREFDSAAIAERFERVLVDVTRP